MVSLLLCGSEFMYFAHMVLYVLLCVFLACFKNCMFSALSHLMLDVCQMQRTEDRGQSQVSAQESLQSAGGVSIDDILS